MNLSAAEAQHEKCALSLSEAIVNATFWVGARCAKRISKSVDYKRRRILLAARFLPRCPPCCLLRFFRQYNARVILTLPLSEMYATVGSALVCDRLRLYGNKSLCDRLRSSGTIRKPALMQTELDSTQSYYHYIFIEKSQRTILWKSLYDSLNAKSHLNIRSNGKRPSQFMRGKRASDMKMYAIIYRIS